MSDTDIPAADGDGMTFVSDRSESGFDRALNIAGIGLFTVLLGLGLAQIVNRFVFAPVFGVSVAWTGEAARFVLIYMTMVGAVIGSRDRDHIRIEVLIERLPEAAKPPVQSVLNVASIAFLVVAAWGGFLATQSVRGVPAGAVPIVTIDYVYAVIPLGLIAMAVYEARAIVELLGRFVGSDHHKPASGVTGDRDE